ncbi:MAG TPA: hypothetical protein VGC88_05520 [Terriglobales bacterium]
MRLTLRAAAEVHQRRLRIKWDDIGCPTQPCTREYKGEIVEVRQCDIEAANGNPNAVFTASQFRLWGGPSYYRLGFVDIPTLPVDIRSKLQAYDEGPRQLLIRWKDLGSPSQADTICFRGTVVKVQHKDILAAKANPDAVFTATKIRPHASPPYYLLGKVELPSANLCELQVA